MKLPSLKQYSPTYLKERIYGSITILVLNISFYIHIDHSTSTDMLVTILTTIIGLWLASLVSDVLAEKLIQPKEKIPRHELGEMYRNSKGILHSSQMTIFVLILSMLGAMPIKSAMLTTIILGSFQFVAYILLTSIYQDRSFWSNVIVISIQFALLGIILLLKILH